LNRFAAFSGFTIKLIIVIICYLIENHYFVFDQKLEQEF